MKINPSFKEAFYGLGMVYGYQNQYEIATLYLDKAIALDKTFLTAWKWRGIMRVEQANYDPALEDFTKAIELSPSDPELYVRRGRVQEKKGAIQPAVTDLRFAAQLAPNDKKTWLYLGDVFVKVNELDQALTYYKNALNIDPKYSDVYAQIAQVWIKKNDMAKARETFDQAVANATYRPERYLMPRGQFLESQGQLEAALADYRAARASNPNLADAWLAEAKLLCQTKDKAGATEAVNKYIELVPTDSAGAAIAHPDQRPVIP